ncbi:hypothetical protein A2U01_0079605, partial [Trifolium medium]|nr:hypothetical protein [Trifolium medium]
MQVIRCQPIIPFLLFFELRARNGVLVDSG